MAQYSTRVATIAEELLGAARDVLVRHRVTYPEYLAFLEWVNDVVDAKEYRMFIDNFFEATIEGNTYADRPGSEGTVQGPYYVAGAPVLTERPFVMPMREDEEGEPCVFTGHVRDLDGRPVAGALIDLWHAGNDGTYSGYVGDAPAFNLRAKMYTDENGDFQVRTIRPAPYQIPHSGPVGRFLEMIGKHAWRPAHFHLKLSADGYVPLVTQIYFRGDQWLGGDVSSAVKDSLTMDIVEDNDKEVASQYGLSTPFKSGTYTFNLPPKAA